MKITEERKEERLVTEDFFRKAYYWERRRSDRYWDPFVLALLETDEKFQAQLESVMTSALRQSNLAARMAGGRIAVLLVRTSIAWLPEFAKRILTALRDAAGDGASLRVGGSGFPDENADFNQMLKAASDALDEARKTGPNGVFPAADAKSLSGQAASAILVVDDDPRNRKLLLNSLRNKGYGIVEADSGEQALTLMQASDFDLVLLDIMMPGINGFDTCRRIKSIDSTKNTPVILMTALDDVKSKITGIEAGADDFLTKPFNLEELTARTASLVRLKQIHSSMTSVEDVLLSLAAAVEAKDHYTQGHTDRTSRLAMQMGRKLSLSDEDINCLRIGGALHDIGKIGVPEKILNKQGPLTEKEWKIMKSHPDIGFRICESLGRTLGHALEVVRHHHEKLDGSSYPDGLQGDQISIMSRIMCVVDIYDALTTNRPYRQAMPQVKAFEILRQESSEGKIDNKIVEALFTEMA